MVETRHPGRLSDDLANTRTQLRDRGEMGRHIVRSIEGHTFEWVTVAFILPLYFAIYQMPKSSGEMSGSARHSRPFSLF